MFADVSTRSVLDNNISNPIPKNTISNSLTLNPFQFEALARSVSRHLSYTAFKLLNDIYSFNYNKCDFYKCDSKMAFENDISRVFVNRTLGILERKGLIERYWDKHRGKQTRYIKIHDDCINNLLAISKPYNGYGCVDGRLSKDIIIKPLRDEITPEKSEQPGDNRGISDRDRALEYTGVVHDSLHISRINLKKEKIINNRQHFSVDKNQEPRKPFKPQDSFFSEPKREEIVMRAKPFSQIYKAPSPPTAEEVLKEPRNFVRACPEKQAECMKQIRAALYGPKDSPKTDLKAQGSAVMHNPIRPHGFDDKTA